MENEKRESVEEILISNQECIRTLGERENCKYLGVLKTDTINKRR